MVMSYESIEDWRADHLRVKNSPNDTKLLASVVRKVENSPQEVQRQIKDELMGIMMEKDPNGFFRMLVKQIPKGKMLVIKSKKDPWFKV